MENDTVAKRVKNNYDFANNEVKAKNYNQVNKEKIRKRS